MKISIIGAGEMGGALASALAGRTSHRVTIRGARPGSTSVREAIANSGGRLAEADADAIASAGLVFVVVPWQAFENVTATLRQHPRPPKRLVSVVVPWMGDNALPAVGTNDSAAERLARALPDSQVAGAFTTVSAATVRAIDTYAEKPTVFVVGDHAETKRLTREVAESIGFASLDAGPLYAARFTEAMGFLWTAAAYEGGAGELIAFRAVLPHPKSSSGGRARSSPSRRRGKHRGPRR